MADAVGLAAELDEPPVVDDAVDHGGGHLVVPEHRPPPAELQIRGDHHRLSLVCVGEDLEEQPRPVRVEREEPELVDDEQAGLADKRGLPVEPPVVAGAPQAHHERGRREEARLEPPLARQRAEGRRHVRLAGADVAHEHEVLPAPDEVEREQRLAPHALRPRHGRPVVAVEGLGRRQRAAPEQRRALRGLAAGPLRLEVARGLATIWTILAGTAPLSQPGGKGHRRTDRSAESWKRRRAVHCHWTNRNTSPPFPQLGKRLPRAPGGAAVAFG